MLNQVKVWCHVMGYFRRMGDKALLERLMQLMYNAQQ